MIAIPAFFRRKGVEAKAKGAASEEKQGQAQAAKASGFLGGAYERTQDLMVGHDGERVGFRKPVQG